jgi:hypothetical protein
MTPATLTEGRLDPGRDGDLELSPERKPAIDPRLLLPTAESLRLDKKPRAEA